jgi:hypothetical protein
VEPASGVALGVHPRCGERHAETIPVEQERPEGRARPADARGPPPARGDRTTACAACSGDQSLAPVDPSAWWHWRLPRRAARRSDWGAAARSAGLSYAHGGRLVLSRVRAFAPPRIENSRHPRETRRSIDLTLIKFGGSRAPVCRRGPARCRRNKVGAQSRSGAPCWPTFELGRDAAPPRGRGSRQNHQQRGDGPHFPPFRFGNACSRHLPYSRWEKPGVLQREAAGVAGSTPADEAITVLSVIPMHTDRLFALASLAIEIDAGRIEVHGIRGVARRRSKHGSSCPNSVAPAAPCAWPSPCPRRCAAR